MDKGSSPTIKKILASIAFVLLLGTLYQVHYPMTWGQFWGFQQPERTLGQRIGISPQPTTAVDIVAQNPRLTLGAATTIAGLIGLNSYSKYSMLKERYKDLTSF